MADQNNKNISDQQQLRMPGQSWPSKTTSSNASLFPPLGSLLTPPSFHIWKKLYSGESSSGPKSQVSQPDCKGKSIARTEEQEAFEKNLSDMEARYLVMQDDAIQGFECRKGRELNPNLDPQKLKRVFANRISAQKSRMRKLQYMTCMESKVKELQSVIAKLSPQIASLIKQKEKLQQESQFMNQQLKAYNETKTLKEAEIALNRAEVKRLRELHLNQQQMQAQLASLNMFQSVGQQHFGYVNPNQVSFAAGIGTQLAPQHMPNPYAQHQRQQGNDNMQEMNNDDSFSSTGSRNFI